MRYIRYLHCLLAFLVMFGFTYLMEPDLAMLRSPNRGTNAVVFLTYCIIVFVVWLTSPKVQVEHPHEQEKEPS